ncbi:MAG: hypothetical protein ABFD07_16515 [Methanobacterium sp.]
MNEFYRLILSIILAFGVAIIFKYLYLSFHEGGHYLAAKISGFKNVKIGYTKYKFPIFVEIDDTEIEKVKNVNIKVLFITICGPLFGLIPFVALYFVVRGVGDALITILIGVVILFYLKDCRKDFEQIVESVRTIRGG